MNSKKKENFDWQVIYSAFRKIVESKAENMEIHLVYAGDFYWEGRLRPAIHYRMKKYKIEKVMVTIIFMLRNYLITKEKMENYCNGKEKEQESVNDDLEKMFDNIAEEPDDYFWTYFLPKLTKEELDFVERKDYDFLNTFEYFMDADVNKAEMMLSESDSKFIRGWGHRRTFTIANSIPGKCCEKSIEKQPLIKKHVQSSKQKISNCCSLQ